jgi:hypothetical protein
MAMADVEAMVDDSVIVRFMSTSQPSAREHALIGSTGDGHALVRVTVGARPSASEREYAFMTPVETEPFAIQVVGRGEQSVGLARRISEHLGNLDALGEMVDQGSEGAEVWWNRMTSVVRGTDQ